MSANDKPKNMENNSHPTTDHESPPKPKENPTNIPAEPAPQEAELSEKVNELQLSPRAGTGLRNSFSEALNKLLAYESDSSSSSSSSSAAASSEDDENEKDNRKFVVEDLDSDDSTLSDDEVVVKRPARRGSGAVNRVKKPVTTEDMLGLTTKLPPVPDLSNLHINFDIECFQSIGKVAGIIGKLITIQSKPGMSAVDIDTVLFLENGHKTLGFVCEVFGQINAPMYVVRFNSEQDITALGIRTELDVYIASSNLRYTKYVCVAELLKMKGSDASWVNDTEVPEQYLDYSDDEKEFAARAARARKLVALKRHKRFEKAMNKRNTINTKLNKYIDSHRQAQNARTTPQLQLPELADFDPTIPPPNMRLGCGVNESVGGFRGLAGDRVGLMEAKDVNISDVRPPNVLNNLGFIPSSHSNSTNLPNTAVSGSLVSNVIMGYPYNYNNSSPGPSHFQP